MRIWKISDLPLLLDELEQGVFALDILNYGILKYIIAIPFLINERLGPMIGYVLLPFLYFLGQTMFALRIPLAIIGILTNIIFFLFVNELFGKKLALLSTLILAVFPAHIILSRMALEVILLPFFLVLSLYFLVKFDKTKNRNYLYLFSMSFGLGLISRLSFVFFLLSFILTYKINPFFKIKKMKVRRILLVFLFFLLGAYPLIYWSFKDNFANVESWISSRNALIKEYRSDVTSIFKYFILGLTVNFPQIFRGTFQFYFSSLFPTSIPLLFPDLFDFLACIFDKKMFGK
ncbi:MAG: glycosyltransferase family 39 protein [Candidatus Aenigmarchaeota archaeon]|nr:glycosyltransferase family 39 protein [Candidatus Aenigmarchaeota archaeon]